MNPTRAILLATTSSAFAFAVAAAAAAAAAPAGTNVVEVAPRAFVYGVEAPWQGNTLVVEMKTGDVVVVGAPYTTAQTRELIAWIDETMGRGHHVHITAIDGHFHNDGAGGNDAFIAAGADVYGSDVTARLLEERGERRRDLGVANAT